MNVAWYGPATVTRAEAAFYEPRRLAGPELAADPNTAWLADSGVALDAKEFVRTGADAGVGPRPLETTQHGVFAIGDVRSGSIKRVAAAVGEGAQVIAAVHAFLADDRGQRGSPAASM